MKRDILEQQRVQAQQNFQEAQIKDLKARIDETASLMAQQTLEFEKQAAGDLTKLQDFQRKQLEDETKRALQMQAETANRANEVNEARDKQQEQSGRLERYLVDQQVALTQQMLEKQKQTEQEFYDKQNALAQREAARQQYLQQQQINQQSIPPPPQSHAAARLPPGHPATPTAAGSSPTYAPTTYHPSKPSNPSKAPAYPSYGSG